MLTAERFIGEVRTDRLVGIGDGGDGRASASAVKAEAMGICRCRVYTDGEAMVKDLTSGRIDAAVRGTLPAGATMAGLRKAFDLDRVLRMAIMQPQDRGLFFLAPVGIDEGWTVDERVELALLGSRLMVRMGMKHRVAVLSGGRLDDRGRNAVVDRSLDDAEAVTALLVTEGIDAYHAEILIESAADEANMIIAPDGISGNLVFRTLHFLGGGRALGAPVLNMDRVFIDTSRVKEDFIDSLALAASLSSPYSHKG